MPAPGNLSCFLKAQAIISPLPKTPCLFSNHIHHLQSFLLEACGEPAAEWRKVGGCGFSTLGVGGACGLGGFLGDTSGKKKKKKSANAADIRNMCSIPGWERSPGGGHGNPLQYSCPENPHGQRTW